MAELRRRKGDEDLPESNITSDDENKQNLVHDLPQLSDSATADSSDHVSFTY